MGIAIASAMDFYDKFNRLKDKRDLFAFFLFDERPSHEAVERFADDEFDWLDGLAAAARIFFFIFLRRDQFAGGVYNPGLEVAKMFGIKPNQLPGVVLFILDKDGKIFTKGVFLPLETKLFTEDIKAVEEVFSDLFSLIQECREKSDNAEELLQNLSDEVASLKRKGKLRPLMNYLKTAALAVINIPIDFFDNLGGELAKEVARRPGIG